MESITSLELIHFYESLVREKRNEFAVAGRFSKAFQQKKKIFKKLIAILNNKKIPPKEFILIQFKLKGHRPYPTQLLSEKAFERWEDWKKQHDVKQMHRTQERYLQDLCRIGYTIEEALSLDVFYYYFRRLYLKDIPEAWHMYADREIERLSGLKEFLERREV